MKTLLYIGTILLFSPFSLALGQSLSRAQADSIVNKYIEEEIAAPYVLYYCPDTTSSSLKIHTRKESYVKNNVFAYFLDERPGTEWDHACQYLFVSKTNGTYEIVNATQYPLTSAQDAWCFHSKNMPAPRSQEIDNQNIIPTTPPTSYGSGKNHAVIINGGGSRPSNFAAFTRNCASIYKTLRYYYGYEPENIHVLISDGKNPAPDQAEGNSSSWDLDGDGVDDTEYAATKEDISKVFNLLAEEVGPEDHVFIFATDHGDIVNNKSVLCLWYEDITPEEFAAEVNKLNAGIISIMMLQCYSGGFIPALAAENRVIVTACAANETGVGGWQDDWFLTHWLNAIDGYAEASGRYDEDEVVDADLNHDGILSFRECFLYTEQQVKHVETPQYFSNPTNLGKVLSLGGTCTETSLTNTVINGDRKISDCNISVTNTLVKKGAKLSLNGQNNVRLGTGFKMETGAELNIE